MVETVPVETIFLDHDVSGLFAFQGRDMAVGKKLRFDVLARDAFTCQYCGAKPKKSGLEVDHVYPRCEGGTDDMENLVTACYNCNRGKGRTIIIPPSHDPMWKLQRGPFDGRSQAFSDKSPLLWVMENCGDLILFEDAWRIGYHGMRIGKPMRGHPKNWSNNIIFNTAQGFDHTTKIIGFYWQHRVSEIMEECNLSYFTPADYIDETRV